jgi:hypothetical protein
MASIREQVLQNIVDTVKGNQMVSIPTVRRDPTDVNKMAKTAFPCVMVESSNEVRNDITMLSSKRLATLEVFMNVWVYGTLLDSKRNELIDLLESMMDEDRTRGGVALNTQLTRVEYRELAEAEPYASMRLVWAIEYVYTQGKP